MPTSPSVTTNGPQMVYRYTIGSTSAEVPAFVIVSSDGTEVSASTGVFVQGSTPPGGNASGSTPLQVAGSDGTLVRTIRTDTSGFLAVGGNVANGAADSGNPLKIGGYANATIPTTVGSAQRVNAWFGLNGQIIIGCPSFTGADAQANTALYQMTGAGGSQGQFTTAGFVFNGTTWDRQRGDTSGTDVIMGVRATAGGLTQFRRLATADTNLAVVKATAGRVYSYVISNTTASAKFVRLYNKATAPVPASDNGLILRTIMVPANGVAQHQVMAGLGGFTAGIAIDATGAVGDTDATALAASDLIIQIDYA